MRILVTGGAGFIGSNFVRYTLEKHPDDRVIVLDALTYAGNLENFEDSITENPNFQFFHGNIIDESLVNELMRNVDTVVHFADQILGKPQSTEEARDMLLKLSGKWHEVITAVYVQSYDQHLIFSCSTDVHFRDISCDILDQYLSTGDSLDKAGSYGVQGAGLLFIDQVRGSYSNVVGFPLSIFMVRLKEFIGATESDDYRSFFI